MEKTEEITQLENIHLNNIDSCRTEWNGSGRCVINIEAEQGCNLDDIIRQFKSTIIGLGFNIKNVEDCFNGDNC